LLLAGIVSGTARAYGLLMGGDIGAANFKGFAFRLRGRGETASATRAQAIRDLSLSHLGERWEYSEVRIPLNLRTGRSLFSQATPFERAARRADRIIQSYLRRLAGAGWQADEAASFASLYRRGRVESRFLGGFMASHQLDGVSVEIKRPLREIEAA
jgi:hypothetical protein